MGLAVADGVSVEFAIQYNAGYKENMYTFANNIRTKEGGTHLAGCKTALTRGIAQGLGYTGRVTSPTFTIVNEYLGETPLFHFDMYRLDDSDALFDIGWEDYLERGGVCVVEWSENVADALPSDAIIVSIARGEKDNERIITVEGGGIA